LLTFPALSLFLSIYQDPHRGNLLKTPDGKLAFIDFGMMADIDEDDRYGLFGLCIGLQSKDLPLVTENLLKVRQAGEFVSQTFSNAGLNPKP
jgi:predicted unusual protein kinase regulating ubiquinone biosynthesis (AarF/ABC1/UbiB family)